MSRSLARRVSCLGFCCVVWTCTGKCTVDFDFWPILKLQAPVEIGLTYDTTKIRITKYETKVDPLTKNQTVWVHLQTSDNRTIELTGYEYGKISSDCLDGDLTDESRKKLGLPTTNPAVALSASSTAALSFDTSDLNGDGLPDIVSTNFRPAGVTVRLANSNGTLRNPVQYPTGQSRISMRMAVLTWRFSIPRGRESPEW